MPKPRLTLIIGPSEAVAARLRMLCQQHASVLADQGIAAPDWNHVRLYAACAAPEAVGVLRFRRGLHSPLVGETLTDEFATLLPKSLADTRADHVVLAAAQLGSLLTQPDEIARLHTLLRPHFRRIDLVAHAQDQARMLVRHYAYALNEGRQTSLEQELALTRQPNWWEAALAARGDNDPHLGLFQDIQAPPHWLDFSTFLQSWEDEFGAGSLTMQPYDEATLLGPDASHLLSQALDLSEPLPQAEPLRPPMTEADATLTRLRQMNAALIRYAQVRDVLIPRDVLTQIHRMIRLPGQPLNAGALHKISAYFSESNRQLAKRFPDLEAALTPDAPQADWVEANPEYGFRATQYLAAYDFALRKNAVPLAEKRAEVEAAQRALETFDTLLPKDAPETGQMRKRVQVNHQMILSSPFRPHNNMGMLNEEQLAAPFAAHTAPKPKGGSTGKVIVACMKDEAPYILEWIAYHRAIGVDHFLIYSNGSSDNTDAILNRLRQLGIIEHRLNDDWSGKSPQQFALNRALAEPVVQNADWIAHIDVDEFMNIRAGNGTLDDLFERVPGATNIAMTWRLFGHNGVTAIDDRFVIDQFDTCAPKFVPKPHTAWGFKTLFRNIGAYGKLSCHRPNKLQAGFEDRVKWVNGSGQDMTRDAVRNGWRSSKSTIGYDLIQLNHYALRSAASFLIKRQRGRALHVDRTIGLNYWVRMDWGDTRDITIKRNLPRLRAEYERLLADDVLKSAQAEALAWHQARATELQQTPEFADLFAQATQLKLNATERAAYALALDTES